jgi:hypothetical protein
LIAGQVQHAAGILPAARAFFMLVKNALPRAPSVRRFEQARGSAPCPH